MLNYQNIYVIINYMIKILVTGGYGLLGDALKNERKNLDVEDYIEWFFLKGPMEIIHGM